MAQAAAAVGRVLVVDDEPSVRLLLAELLSTEGHRVETAGDGAEALRQTPAFQPDLILLDLDMPHVHGFEVCRLVKEDPATRLVPVVIVTAQPDAQARVIAWEAGADAFLTKPFRQVEILTLCRSLLRTKRLTDGLDPAEAVLFTLARAVEAKSPYVHGHSERVKGYALRLARRLGLSEGDCDVLSKGALLHDVGKISIPDTILNKPGPLTTAEFERVKEHTVQGVRIVEPLPSLRAVVPLIRWHHERRDGLGYPDGLGGEAIPLLVRLLSVADVFDSLASTRPYRAAIPPGRCREMLRDDALNGGLDPHLVETFCSLPADDEGDAEAAPGAGGWDAGLA